MLPVEQPFKTYTGLDGKPLDNGYVYFGQPNQDPITHPIAVYWDAAGTQPAPQELRTVNGYIMNTGSPANLFVDGAYSVLVKDSKGRQVFYSRNSYDFSIAQAAQALIDSMRERISIKTFGAVDGMDATQAIRDAFASLNGKPGTVYAPFGTYKITGKVSCLAGQNFVGEGAVLDVSAYDGIFLSYNEADTFDFTQFHPPTLIQGFKVMGKVSMDAPNRNFMFVKIRRTPYVTMRDVVSYYAAAAWTVDESILCTFDSVRCYNPISDSFAFGQTDLVNRFAPNGCVLVNCHIEEQKYPCHGINVTAGDISVEGGYFESLSTFLLLNGGAALVTGARIGLRYQANSIAVDIAQSARLSMTDCDITFAGGWSASSMTGLNINADTELVFNNNRITGLFAASEAATCFTIKGSVNGTINGNTIENKGLGSQLTLFTAGDVAGARYYGTFSNNHVESKAGTTTIFCPASAAAGYIEPHLVGNKFIRVSSFRQLSSGIIENNTLDGAADTISWLGRTGGIVCGNRFFSPGWTIQGALYEESNFGLYDLNKSSNPYVSAYLSGLVAIPNNIPTKVAFGSEEYDTNACYDPATGRFQPKVPGLYHVRALLAWYPSISGVVQGHIYKNGASYIAGENNPDNTNGFGQEVSGNVPLNGTTDYIEIYTKQTSGAAVNLAADQLRATHLQISFVRSLPA